MANQAPTLNRRRSNHMQANAWSALLFFFFSFCLLVALGWYFGWHYYTNASTPIKNTVLIKYVGTGVLWQQPDRAIPQEIAPVSERPTGCPDTTNLCVPFIEGQHVVGRRGAGFGHVAALKLPDDTLVNLHTQQTGFDLVLKQFRVSRWTNEAQTVIFEQIAGYARYDIASGQNYKRVSYSVEISPSMKVELAPGGSYSINVPRTENGRPRGFLITDPPILLEVAVRSGKAIVHAGGEEYDLPFRGKLQIGLDGKPVGPDGKPIAVGENPFQPAQWELVPDGDFSYYTTEQYNKSEGKTPTWNIRSYSDKDDGRKPGAFSVIETCPREKLAECQNVKITYGQFLREANDGKPFITGVDNTIDADVSEYTQSLLFKADVSVIQQSVKNTGERGSECPVIVEITYKLGSPSDGDQLYRLCMFVPDQNDPNYVQDPNIQYVPINWFGIYPVEVDLRKLADTPNSPRYARYISMIRIYASGHDYQSQVTRVSLLGK